MRLHRKPCVLCSRRFVFGFNLTEHYRRHAHLAQLESLMATNRARMDELDRSRECRICKERGVHQRAA